MKKLIPFLVAGFLLSAIVPAHATLIVYGVINGVVTYTSGSPYIDTTVGMPVSGTFSYDYNLLSAPDSLGNRTVSATDPYASFYFFSSVGEGGRYGDDLLQLTVGANGLPYNGSGVGVPDMELNSSFVGVNYGPNVDWTASVTYTITGVPDTSATWLLLGVGLASVTGARRVLRQIRV